MSVKGNAVLSKKEKLVVAWIEIHQEDLLVDWGLAVNGKYFIEWECGADFSADTIEAHLTRTIHESP